MGKVRWIALGVGLVVLLSVAAIAPAKGVKISESSDDFTVDPLGQEDADCGGKRVVSGGFFDEFDSDSTGIPLISRREGESAWTHRAADPESPPSDATVYAYCAKKKKFPKLRESSDSAPITAGEFQSITVDCPGNRRAVSGGFEMPDEFIFVTTSMRSGRGSWTVEFFGFLGADGDVEAFVYCAKDVKLKQRSSETTLSAGEQDTEEARCKRSQRVVSGGFDTQSNGDTTAGIGTTSRRTGKRSWEATAGAAGDPQPLTVYAYCLKQSKQG